VERAIAVRSLGERRGGEGRADSDDCKKLFHDILQRGGAADRQSVRAPYDREIGAAPPICFAGLAWKRNILRNSQRPDARVAIRMGAPGAGADLLERTLRMNGWTLRQVQTRGPRRSTTARRAPGLSARLRQQAVGAIFGSGSGCTPGLIGVSTAPAISGRVQRFLWAGEAPGAASRPSAISSR
jgi:hypothetical protein